MSFSIEARFCMKFPMLALNSSSWLLIRKRASFFPLAIVLSLAVLACGEDFVPADAKLEHLSLIHI